MTPPLLAVWARERGVPCWQPETRRAITTVVRELQPDVAVVVAYGRIIPAGVLPIPKFGFVNLHPSLLPKYRGPSPIQTAILNGDTETGVTLMLLDEEVDHGPILAQERVTLSPTATRSSVERELAERGAQLLERALPDYLAGHITLQPQDHTKATTTPLLSREDGRIDWREPAAVIERKVRAYEGWPGTWCELPNGSSPPPLEEGEREGVGRGADNTRGRVKRLKILRTSLGSSTNAAPGTIVRDQGSPAVACGDGNLLLLDRMQPEGKNAMDGSAFLRGHQGISNLA